MMDVLGVHLSDMQAVTVTLRNGEKLYGYPEMVRDGVLRLKPKFAREGPYHSVLVDEIVAVSEQYS